MEDDETVRLFIEESQDHLGGIEQSLLQIEADGAGADIELVNQVFRAIHSVKGGAGFFGLEKIKDLAHDMENVLNRVREGTCEPTPQVVGPLLESADLLTQMVENWSNSNDVDITASVGALQAILSGSDTAAAEPEASMAQTETGSPEADAEADAAPSVVIDWPALQQELEPGHLLYKISFKADEHLGERDWTELSDRIRRGGTLLASTFDAGSGPHGAESAELAMATVLEQSMLAELLDLPESCLVALTEDAPSADPAANAPADAAPAAAPSAQKPELRPELTPKQTPESKPAPATQSAAKTASAPESTLRVNVRLLDKLMNLAGELVLTRNQIAQSINGGEREHAEQASQRLDLITTEMQEAIMSTRMQPVAVVFSKFRRIVRDLAGNLSKQIDLQIEGEDVELDKTLIEGLSDPLTHLVRNAIDHGIELPAERTPKGKPESAKLTLRAYHEAGQVIIEIVDDGAGIDPERIRAKALESGLRDEASLAGMADSEVIKLIFAPGFSTAKEVTDISGRGVGMDVVNTNLSQLGGIVDIESQVNVGTTVRIKLPLTLAIIPSLMVRLGQDCFALPQVNVQELVRVPPKDFSKRLQRIGDALVLRLRGDLIPVVPLHEIVGNEPTYIDRASSEAHPDRRLQISDRRSTEADDAIDQERRSNEERRTSAASARNIVVVHAGSLRFGIVVDELLDSEEIVVKPLDEYLKKARIYAGATIRGDGRVALILDVVELARHAQLDEQRMPSADSGAAAADEERGPLGDQQYLVLFEGGRDETFAAPVHLISRIEKIKQASIERNGNRNTIVYRGGSLTLFSMSEVGGFNAIEPGEDAFVLVFSIHGREVGLLASSILDTINLRAAIDEETFKQAGIFGSTIVDERTTFLVDLYGVVETMEPEWVLKSDKHLRSAEAHTLLIAEDSQFFLNHMTDMLQTAGYQTVTAEDGVLALAQLAAHPEIDMVLTDIEMPNMDGLELTRAIRANPDYRGLPVIAVTSMAGDASRTRGIQAGVDAYLIKLDKEEILSTVSSYLNAETKLDKAG